MLRRLIGLCGVLAALVVGTFLMVQLIPGDPAQLIAGPNAAPEQVDVIRGQLGLDRSPWHQFLDYVGGLATGDMGTSFVTSEPVMQVIADRVPFTARLALLAIVLVLVVSVPLGIAVAVACRGGRRRFLDTVFTGITSFLGAIPEYVLGVFLIILFAITWKVLPPGGAETPEAIILPLAAVSIGSICTLARIVRRETTVVLAQDYMRTARGRRLRALRLYTRHALPNLLTSTLTVGGLILASLLGGTIIVEFAFNWPGVGTKIIAAIGSRDYPVIQGMVLLLGLIATAINLLVDVLLGLIDPRTLTGKAGGQ